MQASEDFRASAFKFVQELAGDLGRQELDLPGFPDVVMRLHQALADEGSAVQDIVNLISSEPALSVRLIQLANSAAFNADGREISDPRMAIQRLGFNVVRSTATSFAVAQIQMLEWLQPVRPQLAIVWKSSNSVAATCAAVATVVEGVQPDEALSSGLFHLLGKLYLITHAHKRGLDVNDNPVWEEVIAGWHPTIARAILDKWEMPERIAAAVEEQNILFEETDIDMQALPMLTRLLSAAKLHDIVINDPERAEPGWAESLTDIRLSGHNFYDLIDSVQDKLDAVSSTMR